MAAVPDHDGHCAHAQWQADSVFVVRLGVLPEGFCGIAPATSVGAGQLAQFLQTASLFAFANRLRMAAQTPQVMSYDVQLFRREVQEKEQAYEGDSASFFEDPQNVLPFTPAQHQYLHQRLLKYGYQVVSEQSDLISYRLLDASASALLSLDALYFSAPYWPDDDGIFDICMAASEFTDTEEFAKYDPQAGGWEVLEP